jgi:hypothetical protein
MILVPWAQVAINNARIVCDFEEGIATDPPILEGERVVSIKGLYRFFHCGARNPADGKTPGIWSPRGLLVIVADVATIG